jgi:hypothetical protein
VIGSFIGNTYYKKYLVIARTKTLCHPHGAESVNQKMIYFSVPDPPVELSVEHKKSVNQKTGKVFR